MLLRLFTVIALLCTGVAPAAAALKARGSLLILKTAGPGCAAIEVNEGDTYFVVLRSPSATAANAEIAAFSYFGIGSPKFGVIRANGVFSGSGSYLGFFVNPNVRMITYPGSYSIDKQRAGVSTFSMRGTLNRFEEADCAITFSLQAIWARRVND